MQKIFSPGDFKRLSEIVQKETGNKILEKNHSMLESRLSTHMLTLGLETLEEYWAYFEKNEAEERAALKSLMTTHYTFFFREYTHFDGLQVWISNEIEQIKARFNKNGTPFRVWSAACSRGQEVYSLAMFLEIHLWKAHQIPYVVYGTDIDHESVQYAKNGVYPIKEVNSIPQNYLSSNWKRGTGAVKEFAAVHPGLKAKVKFDVLNLLEVPAWKESSFDVIFCRNVFIYFSEENVKKIALDLEKKLNPRALLVTGVSEPLNFKEWPLAYFGTSSYQKLPAANKVTAPAPEATAKVLAPAQTAQVLPFKSKAENYRVLCVDDSPTIQSLIKKIFAQDATFVEVDVANNGQEARNKLNAKKYDVITLDIHMPIVNGIEFLERHYSRQSDPPVIMVSSVNRSDIDLATKALSLGAADYVEKPAMNNLAKSSDEILTKARMAIRNSNQNQKSTEESFDTSLAQKIVVPDASQCLRVICVDEKSLLPLEHIIRAQENEYRSPPTLLLVDNPSGSLNIEKQLILWTERQTHTLRDANKAMRPNCFYVAPLSESATLLSSAAFQNCSLQILSNPTRAIGSFKTFSRVQVLVDESQISNVATLERINSFKVSDVSPATSFPSISVEFFAKIRKEVA